MTYETFVRLLADRLRNLPDVLGVEVADDGQITLRLAGETTGHVSPRNAYRALAVGEPLEGVLAVQVATVTAIVSARGSVAPWCEASGRIMARLERADLAQAGGRVARPWPGHHELWEIVVEDHPTHMRGVLAADAQAWGQEPAGLFAHGLAQLRRLIERGPRPCQHGPRLWTLVAGDGYGASRLLCPDWLIGALPARRAPRGWLVMATGRDALALTPLGEAEDLAQVAAFAAAVRELGRMAHPWPFAPLVLSEAGELRPLAGPARMA